MSSFLETLVTGIMLGGVYALVALGLVVVYKSTKVLNLGYGQIMMVLAYISFYFLVSIGLNLALSLFLVVLVSALLGLVLERFTMRPLLGQPMMSMILITLVIGILIQGIITVVWQDRDKVLPQFMPQGIISFGGVQVQQTYFWSFIIAIIAFLLFFLLFKYTKMGLVMRAVAEDHHTSQSMGISVKQIFVISWVISCIAAAAAGLLFGSISVVSAEMGHIGIAKGLPVILLGGLESISGALLGGIIIGVAELLGGAYIGSEYREIIPFILMLVILLVRPHGLFGLKVIERI